MAAATPCRARMDRRGRRGRSDRRARRHRRRSARLPQRRRRRTGRRARSLRADAAEPSRRGACASPRSAGCRPSGCRDVAAGLAQSITGGPPRRRSRRWVGMRASRPPGCRDGARRRRAGGPRSRGDALAAAARQRGPEARAGRCWPRRDPSKRQCARPPPRRYGTRIERDERSMPNPRPRSGSVTTILRDSDPRAARACFTTEPVELDRWPIGWRRWSSSAGFGSFLDYYYLLKYDARSGDEWDRVMDALAVQETYFWREIDQIRAIVDQRPARIWPGSVERRPIRIWSVPCATGEEPLTIAMLLERGRLVRPRADRDPRQRCQSGGRSPRPAPGATAQRAFRTLPPALREKYFTRAATLDRRPGPAARASPTDVVNLMDTAAVTSPRRARPVIFCRNVFIYFSDQSIRRVVSIFARSMPMPGYLCRRRLGIAAAPDRPLRARRKSAAHSST